MSSLIENPVRTHIPVKLSGEVKCDVVTVISSSLTVTITYHCYDRRIMGTGAPGFTAVIIIHIINWGTAV